MGSRETDDSPPPHHPHLSSMIVRPSDSGGGGGSDYEPGEVRPDPPPYSRSDRSPPYSRSDRSPPAYSRSDRSPPAYSRPERSPPYSRSGRSPPYSRPGRSPPYSRSDRYVSSPGHGERARSISPVRMHARSISPLRHRKGDYNYRSELNNSNGPHRGRGFVGGRGPGRFRDPSPPYGRGRGGDRFPARDFDGPGFDHGPFRGEVLSRNNPNVAPREGDWICSDPACGNLNFARRDYCNHCDRPRFGPDNSPQRNYAGRPRLPGPPMNRTPPRVINGYRSPPRGWSRDGPREFGAAAPPLRNGGRFPDHVRRERPDYHEEDDYRERRRFDRSMPPDLGQRDRGRDNFLNERRVFGARNERRPVSPPLPPPPPPPPPPRGRLPRDARERSRSPVRGVPLKDHRRDPFVGRGRGRGRGRGGRWGMPRDRYDDSPY